jgi:diguanylate cyclase (GGDEF)-like protein/PAS domain S-box-containing protein
MSKQILIIDDEVNVVSALSRLLRRHKYIVQESFSPEQAFEKIKEHDIGVIISDQKMPGCTGIELLHEVRMKYPSIVRIILSGYTENEMLLDAINEGEIYRYIKKPWSNKELLKIIERAFHRWRGEWQAHLLDLAFTNSIEGVFFVNEKGKIYWSSVQANNLLGYDSGEHSGQVNGKMLSEVLVDVEVESYMLASLNKDNQGRWRGKSWLQKSSGKKIPVSMTATRVVTDRDCHHFVYVFYDITEEYEYQKSLEHRAFHDELTKLPNRGLFHDRVERALVQARRNDWTIAILFLDLDDFKPINDQHGHSVGDEVLKKIATRLAGIVREEDTVARVGGDEFAVLLPRFGSDLGKLKEFASKMIGCLSSPIVLFEGVSCTIGVSVGVVIYPESGDSVSALLHNADIAMYDAKNSGKNHFKVYEG